MFRFRSILLIHFLLPALCCVGQDDLEERLKALEEQRTAIERETKVLEQRTDSIKLAIIRRDLKKKGLPKLKEGDILIEHPGHMLVYDEMHEQPKWTAHIASPELTKGALARIDTFLLDPLIGSGTAISDDYRRSGFDRGHLVPSADLRWNYDALKATYYYSNISPQMPDLNRKKWAEMEDWIRRYVSFSERRVFIVTGPVLREDLPFINELECVNEVSIPDRFFKVIADLDHSEPKAIGFLMDNASNEGPVIGFSVSVDTIETVTGLDLFHHLDDDLEDRIESKYNVREWYAKGDPFIGEVEPLKAPLPHGMFNSVQAKYHVGRTATICGTVVGTRRTTKANAVYLNFDRMHPYQDFYATIWEYNGPNFSYEPEVYLLDKQVCVTGKISLYDDIPRISINNEKEVMLYEEAIRPR